MLNKDYKEMLSILLENKVEFLLVGAYAMAFYGYVRATADMDIFINPDNTNAAKLYQALIEFGAPMENLDIETFTQKGIIFQIGVAPRRIDIINDIDGVTFKEAFRDKDMMHTDGLEIPVISKEKLIQNKKSSGRKKDELDVENLENQST